MTKLEEQTTDAALVRSLRSSTCPACGTGKRPSQTFCGRDYYSLPQAMQLKLYRRLGDGYQEAVVQAMQFLGIDKFKLPPEGGKGDR